MKKLFSLFSLVFFSAVVNCGSKDEPDPVGNNPSIVNITIDWNNVRQTIIANGINFEGYHTTGGNEVLAPKFEQMLSTMPTQLARLSMPLKIWEPENDNADPNTINYDKLNDISGVKNTFLRIKELKSRNIDSWLAIWDIANWNISNPESTYARRIIDFDELAESIGTFILYGKQTYGIEPKYISVNEPTIASENGWGGYQLALSPEEQISLIVASGKWFQSHNIGTKWMLAVHKVHPSELAQAKQIFENQEAKKYIDAVDFHAYSLQKPEMENNLKIWGDWIKSTGLPVFCGECDYDNRFWENPDRGTWQTPSINYGQLLNKLFNHAYISGMLPWYGNYPSNDRPYRYVSKHFMECFSPGTDIVSSTSSSKNILITSGKKNNSEIILLQNISGNPYKINVNNVMSNKLKLICSSENNYFENKGTVEVNKGVVTIELLPCSMATLITYQ